MPNWAQFVTQCFFTQNFIIIDSVFLRKAKIEVQRDVRKKIKKFD